jgi:peptide/nickel transport system substrate-binding protein
MQSLVQTDPALVSSDTEVLVAAHVYDYLVDVDPQNRLVPRLAKEWKTSEDGLTYTFTLQEGVAFQDGAPLTAQDVVWTFNRLRDPANDFPTKDLYSKIVDIQANGDLEVIFTLNQTNPFFLYDLSDNHALVMKADTADPSQFNGTGPFRVESYSPEDRITLKANPSYFVSGQPRLETVEIIFFADDTAVVDALRSGQVDLAMRIPTPLYQGLAGEQGITSISIPTNSFDLIRLRSDRAPGNDPRVVQAFKLATDRQAAFQIVEQGLGAVGRDSPIGPLYANYYSEDTPIPSRDGEAAKKLLAEAGYPDGLEIDLHTTDTGNRQDLAAVLKEQWAEAGIDANIVVEPESVYFGDNGWLEVDLGITNWGSRPYPQFYLDVMLVCNAVWNEARFCDPEFDELAKLAGTTLDEAARTQSYQDIQRILIERGPIIVTSFWPLNTAIRDQFAGFTPKAFAGRTDLRAVSQKP